MSTQLGTGALRSTREGAARVRFELVDFEDASLKGALELNALEDANVEKLGCRLWGDASCAWVGTWKRKEA